MMPIGQAASEFLANGRIAVTGVSRNPKGHGANIVYQRLRSRGYEVFPVNPNAEQIEGDRCWADVVSIPGGVDAVVIATRPDTAEVTMRECIDLDVRHVWMHRSVGSGSVSPAAAEAGRRHDITVIDGGCPLMFGPSADVGHRGMRMVCTRFGTVPRQV
jgi:uncharacterized protein